MNAGCSAPRGEYPLRVALPPAPRLIALVDAARRVRNEHAARRLDAERHRRQSHIGDRKRVLVEACEHLDAEVHGHVVAAAAALRPDLARTAVRISWMFTAPSADSIIGESSMRLPGCRVPARASK